MARVFRICRKEIVRGVTKIVARLWRGELGCGEVGSAGLSSAGLD